MKDIFAKIDLAVEKIESAKQTEIDQENAKREAIYKRVNKYAPRIAEMVEVLEYMLNKGFIIPELYITEGRQVGGKYLPREFFTDGIDHRLGFFNRRENGVIVFGVEGGGCNGRDFKTNARFEFVELEGEHIYALECKARKVWDGFDEFANKFYAYINNLAN